MDLGKSPLARQLLRQFVRGAPASDVQAVAQATLEEYGEATTDSVRALASIGNHGLQPSNALRDLLRIQWRHSGDSGCRVMPPALYWVDIDFRSQEAGDERVVTRPHPLLLPHDYVAQLGKDDLTFECVLLGAKPIGCMRCRLALASCVRNLAQFPHELRRGRPSCASSALGPRPCPSRPL